MPHEIGAIETGHADGVDFGHGKLAIGQAMAPPIIGKVKGLVDKDSVVIIDASPGTSCPVVEAIKGSDFCLLVTEPTLSGIHDMERVLGVCKHFNIPAMVCINKYDLNEKNTIAIHDYCRESGVDVAAMIPFDNAVTEAMVRGVSIVEHSNGRVAREIKGLWQNIDHKLQE